MVKQRHKSVVQPDLISTRLAPVCAVMMIGVVMCILVVLPAATDPELMFPPAIGAQCCTILQGKVPV